MSYKFGEKFSLKNVDLELEIKSVLPAGQPLQLNYSGETIYNVCINGTHVYLKESFLNDLISKSDSGKITEVSTEKSETISTTLPDTENNIEPKRRGRPKKI